MHHILPGDYFSRPQGEKDLIWALASYELDPDGERAARPRRKVKKGKK